MGFSKAFAKNKDAVRVRAFEINGQPFKVKVPLTAELEAMYKRINETDETIIQKYYENLTKSFVENQQDLSEVEGVTVLEDDVIVNGKSIKDIAKEKSTAEKRIVEMFKLLVPEEEGFDMSTLTYDMIEETFPFAVQIEIMEAIGKTISPDYKDHRKK